MNILFVATHSGFMGGNQSLLQLCLGLRSHVNITVMVPSKKRFWIQLKKYGIKTLVFPSYGILSQNGKRKLFRKLVNRAFEPILTLKLKRYNFDLIITNSAITYLYAKVANRLGVKHVWHIRENLHEHTNLIFDDGYNNYINNLLNLSFARIYSSRTLKDSYDIENNPKQYKIIYDGVIWMKDTRVRNKQLTESPVLLFIGSLSFEKGITYACRIIDEIIKIYPNAKLKLVGNFTRNSEEFINNNYRWLLNNGTIIHIPFTKNTVPLYCGSDFLLSLSKFEGFGRNVAEAMLRKLLICGFNTGAIPELLGSRYDSIICEYGDVDLIVKGIVNTVKNPSQYFQMVENSYRRSREIYTIENCSNEYLRYINTLRF